MSRLLRKGRLRSLREDIVKFAPSIESDKKLLIRSKGRISEKKEKLRYAEKILTQAVCSHIHKP